MDEKEKLDLWENYIKTRNPKIREQLIVEYAPLVRVVAGRMGMYLGYTEIGRAACRERVSSPV